MSPARPTPRRRPGRPATELDTRADLREALLSAALDCFVRDGVRATTLRAVSSQAGTTPALLHYYFGDKELLIEAVVEVRLLPVLAELGQGLTDADTDACALAEGFAQTVLDVAQRHPWLPSLWVREVLSDGGALRERLVGRIAPLLAQPLAERFARAQQRGQLPTGVDPRLLVVSLIGLSLFPLAAAPIWRGVFTQPELGTQALRRHTLALIRAALENPHVA